MEKYFTKNGKAVIVRQPTENNAASIIDYLKILIASTDQIVSAPQDFTISNIGGKSFINNLDKDPNSLVLIAEIEHQVIAYLEFTANSKIKMAHTGSFVVNVHPDYQHNGIGKILIQTLLNWAKHNNTIEKVYIDVLHTNSKTINLLKGFGFTEEGRHIKAIKQLTGEYADIIRLYFWTK